MFQTNLFFPEHDEAINKALKKATPDQLRSIALAVARFACERTKLKDTVIEQALLDLQNGRYEPFLKKGVERIVDHWDEYAFKMREIEEERLAPITSLPDDTPFFKGLCYGVLSLKSS